MALKPGRRPLAIEVAHRSDGRRVGEPASGMNIAKHHRSLGMEALVANWSVPALVAKIRGVFRVAATAKVQTARW